MASEATERLLVRIDATTEQLRRELKRADSALTDSQTKVERVTARIQKSFAKLNSTSVKLGAAFAALGVGFTLNKVIKNTEAQEAALAQLNATLTSTQGAAGKTAEELVKTAASLQQLTRYGDESIIQMQSLLLTFKEIKGDNFDRTTRAVLDMATAMKQDLKSAAIQLGKALNDPAANLGALSRAGVTFSESQKETIKQMQAVGDLAGAQTLILKELESQFGGAAEAARGTLGGAIDGLSMAFNDLFEAQSESLGGVKQGINELEAILSDPKMVESIHAIAEALLSIVSAAAQAIGKTVELTRFLSESFAAAVSGPAIDDMPRVQEQIANLEKELEMLAGKRRGRAAERRREIEKELEILRSASALYEELDKTRRNAAKASEKVAEAVGEEATATMETAKANAKLTKEREKAQKALDTIQKTNEKYLEDLEWEVDLLQYSEKEKRVMNALRDHGAQLTMTEQERLAQLVETLYDEEQATKAASKAKEDLSANISKAKEEIDPFVKSLQGMAERIDGAFADAWQGAFDSFKDFADGLKAAFRQLLGELLNQIFTANIGKTLFASIGIGGSTGAMASGGGGILSGISGAGGVMPWLTGGVSSGLASLGGAYTGIGNFFGAGSTIGNAALSQGRLYQYGSVGQGLGSLGLNLGAGFLGNYLGSQVFGGTSGIGSAVGGFAGSIFGPLGTGIGSFLGSGIEKGLGNLLGFGSGGNNSAIGDFNFGTGSLVSAGVGKNFSEKNLQAVQQIEQVLAQFANAIGGSEASFRVRVGNKSGFKLDGQKFKEAEDLIAEGFKRIAEAATDLSPALKKLISDFEGTADETAQFAAGIVNISRLMERNPIEDAVKDFKAQLELAGMSTRQIYDQQIMAIERMIDAFDGSLESTNALNTAMTANKQLAYDLAMALQAVNQQINANLQSNINYFKQQTQTPTERIGELEKVFTFFFEGLKQATDPAQIQFLQEALSGVSRELFNLAPPELQRANVDFFIDRERAIAQTAKEQLLEAGFSLAATQENLNMQVGTMLDGVSGKFQASANTLESAAQIFMQAVQFFTGNATGQYEEITA